MMPSHIEADGLCSYTAMTVGLLGSQSFVVRQKMQLVEASHCHMDFFVVLELCTPTRAPFFPLVSHSSYQLG